MRLRGSAGFATLVLALALLGSTGATVAAQAGSAAAGPMLAGRRLASTSAPPTTAQCRAQLHISCYSPLQIEQAYHLGSLYAKGYDGSGRTIVLVDSFGSPTIAQDLSTFDSTYGLPAPPSLRIIQPAGQVPAYNPSNSTMVSWAFETTLDVEYAHAVAPGAHLLLVETPVAETVGVHGFPPIVRAEEYVVNHGLGDVISQSLAASEISFPSTAALLSLRSAYEDAYQHHVSVLGASGDWGLANPANAAESRYFTKRNVNWPASDPLVTAVGGTELHLNAKGDRTSPDTVWNDTYNDNVLRAFTGGTTPTPFATGGGRSAVFTRPAYQDGVRSVAKARRGVPDVSMSASCSGSVLLYISIGGVTPGWYFICGTSEASPLFAGVVAIADQYAGRDLGLLNPALYLLAAAHAPGIVDVTSGNNTVSFTQNGKSHTVAGFNAKPGYDLDSGVGTIDAAKFVPELAATG